MSDVSSSPPSDPSPDPGSEPSFNWRHLLGVVVLVAIAAGAWWIITNERGADEVVGRVADSELTEADLIDLVNSTEPRAPTDSDVQPPDAIDMAAARGMLQQWLIVHALEAELAAQEIAFPQSAIDDTLETFRAQGLDPSLPWPALQAKSTALAEVLTDHVEASIVVDIELPEWICSSHILLETEEEALEALARAEAGEDFAELAVELSIGPSGPNGGNLDCVPTAQFIPEFVEGARTSGGSGLVGPVETQFGFHVIDVRSIGELSVEMHTEMEVDFVATELARAEAEARDAELSSSFAEFVSLAEERIIGGGFIAARYGEWVAGAGLVAPDSPTG